MLILNNEDISFKEAANFAIDALQTNSLNVRLLITSTTTRVITSRLPSTRNTLYTRYEGNSNSR